jgi:hypothetical protein
LADNFEIHPAFYFRQAGSLRYDFDSAVVNDIKGCGLYAANLYRGHRIRRRFAGADDRAGRRIEVIV